MSTIEIFEPALCCATGVCGVDVDQALVNLTADVQWAKDLGANIVRRNLATEPLAFAQSAVVKGFLERSGAESLPLVLVGGEIALAGRYPTRAEIARWAEPASAEAACCTPQEAASGCCPAPVSAKAQQLPSMPPVPTGCQPKSGCC